MAGWEQEAIGKIRADPLNMIIGQVTHGSLVTHVIDLFRIRPSAVIGYSLGESSGLFATGAWADRELMMSRMRDGDLFKTQLADPAVYGDSAKTALFSRERSALEQKMEKLSTRWEQAATELEALENRLREEGNG